MSWFKGYSHRLPISLTSAVTQAAAIWHFDLEVDTPDSPSGAGTHGGIMSDLFWDTIDVNARTTVVTTFDGITKMGGWSWAGFDKDDRIGTLTASYPGSEPFTEGITKLCWLYFGGPSMLGSIPNVANYSLVPQVDLLIPNRLIVPCRPEQSGATEPATSFPILTGTASFDQTFNIFWDVTEIIGGRTGPYNRSLSFQEVGIFRCEAYDEGGSAAPSILDNTDNSIIVFNGRTYCKTWVTGLQDGTNYTLVLLVHISPYAASGDLSTHEFRCSIETINPVTPV